MLELAAGAGADETAGVGLAKGAGSHVPERVGLAAGAGANDPDGFARGDGPAAIAAILEKARIATENATAARANLTVMGIADSVSILKIPKPHVNYVE
jgi:hypothetical protein